jgi:TPP-dependent pyruvate/acetoin dehydrogenase alpha subunit
MFLPGKEQLLNSIFKIGAGYEGLNRFQVDGTNLQASYKIARQAVDLARSGQGPCGGVIKQEILTRLRRAG